jgi:molybdenum cofactor biosynthesis protein B
LSHEEHRRHGAGAKASLALLTVSDTRTERDDRSGSVAKRMLEAAGHRVVDYGILPDDPDRVRERVEQWLGREDCDGVIVNGGTGISPRDRTYEALAGLLDKRLDGFGELFRMLSWEQVESAAMLSRATGGIARGRLLFSVPGSTAAVELALERLILPELGHLLSELRKR